MDNTSAAERWCVAPVFIVDDVVLTANYYRDTLGFASTGSGASHRPSAWCDAVEFVLMLSQFRVTGVMRHELGGRSGTSSWTPTSGWPMQTHCSLSCHRRAPPSRAASGPSPTVVATSKSRTAMATTLLWSHLVTLARGAPRARMVAYFASELHGLPEREDAMPSRTSATSSRGHRCRVSLLHATARLRSRAPTGPELRVVAREDVRLAFNTRTARRRVATDAGRPENRSQAAGIGS
jgi:hypothetical protein